MNASPNTYRASCVCNYSGHCFACIAYGVRCERAGCRATCSDGVRCGAPAPARRAPAMPEAELVDEPMGPGARALAVARARPFDAEHVPGAYRMPIDECRERAAKVRASSESRPGRALSLDDLDAHERARFSAVQPRVLGSRVVSASRARGVA